MDNIGSLKKLSLYDTVSYAGYEWYVIGIDNNTATLLAKNSDFGMSVFDNKPNDYIASKIREYLNTKILSDLFSNGTNLIPTKLNDVGSIDKIWLLSVDEVEKLPINIKRFSHWYWLRSSDGDSSYAASVYHNGDFYAIGLCVPSVSGSVRPVVKVHISNPAVIERKAFYEVQFI
jgi:hypothetical protein